MLSQNRLPERFSSVWVLLPVNLLSLVLGVVTSLAAQPSASGGASWERQWDALVAAAKKEGRLVLFGSAAADARVQIPAAFKDQFGISIEYVAGSAREIVARLQSERGAGLYNFDVVIAGTGVETLRRGNMLDPLRPILIHPDAGDASKWKLGGLFFLDPQRQYVMRLSMYTSPLRVINSAHVKPEEVSWQGLLNPKWKARISTLDPRERGGGQGHAAYILYQLGEEYFTKLYLGQQIVLTRDTRQQADWLVRGTYPVAIGVDKGEFARLRKDGFPAVMLPSTNDVPEYSTSGTGYVGLVNRAAHPNAAKLFVNWLITKDGHEVYNRGAGVPGMRSDLDYPWAVKEILLQPGWKYLDSDGSDYRENIEPKLVNRLKELLSK